MVECPECKAPVSDKAAACVKCGYPLYQALAPRFDGIYVSNTCTKSHGELPGDWLGNVFRRMSRPMYVRAYVRFFEDGLMVYAGAVVNNDPTPARPTLHRTWGDEKNRFQWTKADGQLRISAWNGFVSSVTIDDNRLAWNIGTSPEDELFEFLATLP